MVKGYGDQSRRLRLGVPAYSNVAKSSVFMLFATGVVSIVMTFIVWSKTRDTEYRTDTLLAAGILQCILGLFMLLRGSSYMMETLFKEQLIDAVLTLHALFTTTIITGVWLIWVTAHNDHKGPHFKEMTTAVVFAQFYSAMVLTTLFGRTGDQSLNELSNV